MTLPFRRRHHDAESTHDRARDLVSRELLEPLAEDEATWLARHLDGCAECRRDREAWSADRDLLRSLRTATPQPPRDLWARTSAALDQEAARRAGSTGARSGPRFSRAGWRGLPLGAAAGTLVLLIVFGAVLIQPSPTQLPPGSQAAVASPPGVVAPTPITVAARPVSWLRVTADGSYQLVTSDLQAVCPRSDEHCQPPLHELPAQSVDLATRPASVTLSPQEDQLVVASEGDDTRPSRILIVPVTSPRPGSSPTPDLSSLLPSVEPPGSDVPGSPLATPEATPPGQVEIASGVRVVGEVAYSENGAWLAFSARPSDGSTGPDLYVWAVGSAQAMPITSDHQTYFSGWLGDRVLASSVELAPPSPTDSAAPGGPEPTPAPSQTASPGAKGNGGGKGPKGGNASPSPSVAPAVPSTPSASDAAPSLEGHPHSFLLDPVTLTVTPLTQADVWMPVVDAGARFAVHWTGTLRSDDSGVSWQLGSGQLVLDRWATSDDAAATAAPSASPEGAGPVVGPVGVSTALVSGPTAAFTAMFDPTGTRLAVWVAEHGGDNVGRLHLLLVDPASVTVVTSVRPLPGVPALRRFSMDTGRLAWVSPSGQDGEESTVQVLAWSAEDFGEIKTIPSHDLYIVR